MPIVQIQFILGLWYISIEFNNAYKALLLMNFVCIGKKRLIFRLIICSIMIAAKYLDDFYYKNDYYAKIGGISFV